MAKASSIGHWGEGMAAEYLRSRRYALVACNYHTRFGEIDIIAQNRHYVVFVEVKTRQDARFAQAREFVTNRKQARIRASAQIWLEQHPTELQPRFDVIEVYAAHGAATKLPSIRHIEDAF